MSAMYESRAAWLKPVLLAAAAVFILANLLFLRQYMGALQARQETRQQLNAAAKELSDMQSPADMGQLAAQLAQVENDIKGAERLYPASSASFDLLFQLSRAATEAGVSIAQLRSEPVGREKLVAGEHWAVRYTVEGNGSVANLTAFLERVERLNQSAMVIDNLILRPQAGQPDGGLWTMAFQVVVYSREEPKASITAPPPPPLRVPTPQPQT